jgi:hypothetical protein
MVFPVMVIVYNHYLKESDNMRLSIMAPEVMEAVIPALSKRTKIHNELESWTLEEGRTILVMVFKNHAELKSWDWKYVLEYLDINQ